MVCQGVSILAFHSNDQSSNPAKVFKNVCKIVAEENEINKKRPGLAPLKMFFC